MATYENPVLDFFVKFTIGGIAGAGATLVVQPLDLAKTRLQITSKGAMSGLQVLSQAFKSHGFLGLYEGLSGGIFKQATYTATRLSVYGVLVEKASRKIKRRLGLSLGEILSEESTECLVVASNYRSRFLMGAITKRPDGEPPSLLLKTVFGLISGMVGSFVGTPAEVSLIRLTVDGVLPPSERRHYKHVFHALSRIPLEEGISGLWRGAVPTIGRGMIVNATQLVSYSQTKENLLESGLFEDGFLLQFCASMISGFITTAVSMPVDIAKTRIQNKSIQKKSSRFHGMIYEINRVIQKEGICSLWKGFTPSLIKLGPHTVITFVILEQLTNSYKTYSMKQNTEHVLK